MHWGYGLLLGLPAAVGAVGGTSLQQRVGGPLLSYGFAALLAVDRDLAPHLMVTVLLAIVIGLLAGAFGGLFGVGGGIIFVPSLVLLFDLGQVDAEATSLLAILPVVAAGAWSQHRYENVRWRAALDRRACGGRGRRARSVHGQVALRSRVAAAVRRALPRSSPRNSRGALTVYPEMVTEQDDLWLGLVDEPIGAIVSELEAEDPELRALVATPEKLLAFRTFANIRVGIVLGRLLMEEEVDAYDGSETWVEALLRNPKHRDEIAAEVRSVAEELAEEDGESPGPDEAARDRFQEFARRELGG